MKKILIVEDDSSSFLVSKAFLKRLNVNPAEVTWAKNGNEALEIIKKESWNLILLDIGLPDISGIEVLEEISNTDVVKNCPVVIVSSSSQYHHLKKCFQLGATDYISKGASFDEFQARLTNIVQAFEYRTAQQTNLLTLQELPAVSYKTQEFWHDISNCMAALELTRELKKSASSLPDECKSSVSKHSPYFFEMIESLDANTSLFTAIFNETIQRKKEKSQATTFCVRELSDEILRVLHKKINENDVQINVEAEEIEELHSYKHKVSRILFNLVSNSVQALKGQEQAKVSISFQKSKDNLVSLKVIDNGPGVPAKVLQNIGLRYNSSQSKKNIGVNSGLGLSIVTNTVHELGGKIKCSSDQNGTTCEVLFQPAPKGAPGGGREDGA